MKILRTVGVDEDIEQLTCCFTGHRNIGMSEREVASRTRELIKKAIDIGYTHFISGGAVGFDMIAAEMVLFFKAVGYEIKLEVAVPSNNQEIRYSERQKSRYKSIITQANAIHQSCLPYNKGCYMLRNKYMVSKSLLVIAYYEQGRAGGTKNTIEYAEKNNKEIWYI
jgi:uncharacterized phage-like protein YoqJ